MPDLNGLDIFAQAEIYNLAPGSTSGVFGPGIGWGVIDGNARFQMFLFARWGINYGLTYNSVFTNFGPMPADGDVVKVRFVNVSGGGTTYDILSYVNGVLVNTRSAVTATLTDDIIHGVGSTVSNFSTPRVQFDNYEWGA